MVGAMYKVFYGTEGPPSRFDYEDDDDVLAWPALAAPMRD
jgi:hypothetical protein